MPGNNSSYVCEIHDTELDDKNEDAFPEGNILIKMMNGRAVNTFALCLLDSGSTVTLLNQRALPSGVIPKVGKAQAFTTTQGTYSAQNHVQSEEIFFPDFCKTRFLPKIQMRLFNSTRLRYDVIVGRDVLKLGFVLDHAQKRIVWDSLSIPVTPSSAPDTIL